MGGCKYCLHEKRILNLERELNRASADRSAALPGLTVNQRTQAISVAPGAGC